MAIRRRCVDPIGDVVDWSATGASDVITLNALRVLRAARRQ